MSWSDDPRKVNSETPSSVQRYGRGPITVKREREREREEMVATSMGKISCKVKPDRTDRTRVPLRCNVLQIDICNTLQYRPTLRCSKCTAKDDRAQCERHFSVLVDAKFYHFTTVNVDSSFTSL